MNGALVSFLEGMIEEDWSVVRRPTLLPALGTGEDPVASGVALLFVALLPLLLLPALLVRRSKEAALALAPWTAVPALGLAVAAEVAGDSWELKGELPWLLLGTRLGIDSTAHPILLFTSLLWLLSGVYAGAYLAGDRARHRFFGFYLAAMSGNLGLILAQDAASFALFFALMSFTTYGLIVHEGTAEVWDAGRVYIALVVLGEALFLAGALGAVAAAGTTDLRLVSAAVARAPERDWILPLIASGLGVKVGVLGLHVWLPPAHSLAPTPASAVLSGAMIKAGLLGWLRFLPLGEAALPAWGATFVGMGLAAAYYGVAVGLTQDHPKSVLAYSSVSQMGLMTVGVGVGLSAPSAWPAALIAVQLYALHHGLNKGALFLGVGRAAPGSALRAGLLLPALALAGAPLTGGALAKAALGTAAAMAPGPPFDRLGLPLALAAVGTTLLMARFLWLERAWMVRKAVEEGAALKADFPDGPPPMATAMLAWTTLVVLAAILPWPATLSLAPDAVRKALSPAALWESFWPVAAGVLLVGGAVRLGSRIGAERIPRIPTGDLLVVYAWLARIPSQARGVARPKGAKRR